MKRLLLLFGLILCMCSSCSPLTKHEYECTITYTIENTTYTGTINMSAPDGYTPVYICKKGELLIGAAPETQYVSVQYFDYKTIRTYKVSRFDGRELKSKKK